MLYDVAIIGGGPSGLSAALALGRARKRILLCDAGPRRNAAAVHVHNFVTRDGTPPEEFRQVGRTQLAHYPNVEARALSVTAISGSRGAFRLQLSEGTVEARRILLATGMVDEMLPIEGFRELWGSAVFQCPYCHGWEVQDRRWACLARTPEWANILPFAMQLRGWSKHVTLFMTEAFELPQTSRAQLTAAGVQVELSPVKRLIARGKELQAVELASGAQVPCDVLFAHPPQQQVALIRALGVALDNDGFVQVDPMRRETSIPGIYAGGDLSTRMQGAIFAAAAGTHAAAMINLDLTIELASSGAI
jgi:thioredoxin reductase